jgi:multiple sugar transport system permease protein
MSGVASVAAPQTLAGARPTRRHRTSYLAGAVCIALCTIMLLPLLASVLASVKTTVEAAAVPPTYFPHALSLDSYQRLWSFQAGLLTYLGNSAGAALLTILFCLALTIPAGYALACFPIPFKEPLFALLLLGLIVPYQALLTPHLLHVRAAWPAQLACRAGHRPHRHPAPVQRLHHAQRLRGGSA